MMWLGLRGKGCCMQRLLSMLATLACFSSAALGANKISGSVRNESRGEPAAGDEVILFRLDKRMQEEARAKTDATGAFSVEARHPDKPYLVRVVHQGVSYDQRAFDGESVSIQVFDAAPKVPGVSGTIEILRAGTKGNMLHVSDMVEIKNESSPPVTQVSEHTFEAFLPANAKIDSVLAAGPGKISEMISAAPVPGEPGHYTVNFPLRPGATRFAFNYDLPYRGRAAFQTRHAYPLQQFGVMIPRTMKFSSRSPAFERLATGSGDYQVRAAMRVNAGEGPEFEVSGTGALPVLGDPVPSRARSDSPASPKATLSAPAHTAMPYLAGIDLHSKQTQPPSQWFILNAVTAVLLAACALLVWRTRKAHGKRRGNPDIAIGS
jgi:hypothetical protein